MAADEMWAAQSTFARLRNRGIPAEEIKIPNLLALVSSALKRTAEQRPDLFLEDTTLTLSSGVGDLTDLEGTDFLLETLDGGQIFHSDSDYPLQPLADEAQLRFPWSRAFIYYCISGKSLKTLNTDGGLDTLSGDLRVIAAKIPAIGDIDTEQKESEFLDRMEMMALPPAPPKKK